MMPSDKDAREKYELTRKEHNLRMFAKSIETEDKKVVMNLQDLVVEESY